MRRWADATPCENLLIIFQFQRNPSFSAIFAFIAADKDIKMAEDEAVITHLLFIVHFRELLVFNLTSL